VILAHIATAASAHISHLSSLAMFQDAAASSANSFSLVDMWNHISIIPKLIVGILFVMSIWSLAVMIDRALYFSAARSSRVSLLPKWRAL